MSCNRTRISGRLATRQALRYTPSGVAIIEFSIEHRSEQTEAGVTRKVACGMPAVAVDALAHRIATYPAKALVEAEGFLDRASRTNGQLVLHVEKIDLIE